MPIGVVATLKVQPGKEDDFIAVFKDLQAQVRANEKGCLQYDLCRSQKEPATFVIMEQYADADALKAHGKTAYFQAAFPKLGAVLAGAPAIEYLDKLS